MQNKNKFRINYKRLSEIKWAKWGGEAIVYFAAPPLWAQTPDFFGKFSLFVYFQGKYLTGYQNLDASEKVARKLIVPQKKSRIYIDGLIKRWELLTRRCQQVFKEIEKADFSQLSEKKFLALHKKFAKLCYEQWKLNFRIEPFDFFGNTILDETIQKYSLGTLKEEEIKTLVSPTSLPYLQQEKLELLKLVLQISKDKQATLFLKILAKKNLEKIKQAKYYKALSQHTKKYFYIKNNWGNVWRLDEFYFSQKIKGLLKINPQQLKQEVKEMENYSARIKNIVYRIQRKHKVPQPAKNIFYFFARMTDWRDQRKQSIQIGNYYAEKFLEHLSQVNNIKKSILENADPFEIKSVHLSKEYTKELKLRAKGGVFVFDKNNYYKFVAGKEAEKAKRVVEKTLKVSEKRKEIKGVCANKGIARGKAKIIFTHQDFQKIKRGDILVTSMTRPEFVPVLKKVLGVVTDEGGITCHAAIVSRELGIPCIIGTKVATDVLRTGDVVQLDLQKGTVKVLEK